MPCFLLGRITAVIRAAAPVRPRNPCQHIGNFVHNGRRQGIGQKLGALCKRHIFNQADLGVCDNTGHDFVHLFAGFLIGHKVFYFTVYRQRHFEYPP